MKSPKERQRAYRERRKEHKNAGLTKLKILASATAAKRLEILSEIDSADLGTVLGQAVELLWTQRFGGSEVAPESVMQPKKEKPLKMKAPKPEKVKPEKKEKAARSEEEKAAKPDKPKKKTVKPKSEIEAGSSEAIAGA